ncbi:hypothetical protein CEXT_183931 [Caerostris extrusa]|uniref:Uncharacterized protein n=1 Tax=Caerostris extrusa TaxID=172846 RepID=A0AAV4XP34_CAEEX|nr:hypothetical protein CEXT_183931 [Caerostris extrusa]
MFSHKRMVGQQYSLVMGKESLSFLNQPITPRKPHLTNFSQSLSLPIYRNRFQCPGKNCSGGNHRTHRDTASEVMGRRYLERSTERKSSNDFINSHF